MATEHTGGENLTRSLELLWGTKEEPSRGPKRALDLEKIVATAVALADQSGLSGLSMRRVAAELGIGTMSLYRYVPGKGELIDLMVDQVNGPSEDLDQYRGMGWRPTMEFVAESSWDLYTGSPWLIQVNQSRPLLGPASLASTDFAVGELTGLGLSGREKMGMLVAIDNYVMGSARNHVLSHRAAEDSGVSDEEFWAAQHPFLEHALETGNYPDMGALEEDAFTMEGKEAMLFGLRPMLDGFEALIAGRNGAR